jgi:hypothetical protein
MLAFDGVNSDLFGAKWALLKFWEWWRKRFRRCFFRWLVVGNNNWLVASGALAAHPGLTVIGRNMLVAMRAGKFQRHLRARAATREQDQLP